MNGLDVCHMMCVDAGVMDFHYTFMFDRESDHRREFCDMGIRDYVRPLRHASKSIVDIVSVIKHDERVSPSLFSSVYSCHSFLLEHC